MTENSGITIRQLLPKDRFEGMKDAMRDEMAGHDETGKRSLALGFIGQEAESALREVLDCDVFTVLAGGWCKARELHEYSDPEKHPPGERTVVHLGEHALTATLHPTLEISIGRVRVFELRFTLEVSANFRAAALSIRSGCITALETGDASVSTQLKYGGRSLHKRQSSKLVKLPGRVSFAEPGLRIG
ncbi:hypothetical protein GCM10027084_20140 [Pseudoxanthomonas sangjuensis]|uniref:hypothetical protein n=1 Tax=Pseudoxanthomonas sangjuensis TaxID=1503750 RepID=UPI00139139BF|nr:hypothetical protein [Pseudoxanthomonas sangjuensis]KAF1715347.1 hypothetical protein CSC71_01285 [Pseudoxanthomonas sangjuensis]